MFGYNRKKQLRNKICAAVIGVVVMTLGIWLNYNNNVGIDTEQTVQKIEVEEETVSEEKKNNKTKEYETKTDTGVENKTYLIKEVDGIVNVYICDEKNNKELYLITSIPFDLLSENDQRMFKEGVTLDSDDDLGSFLENFDS